MKPSAIRPISDEALTLAVIACFIALPISIIVFFGSIMGRPAEDPASWIVEHGLWLLPHALFVCPIAAVVFHALKWRRATWVGILIPPGVLGVLVVVVVVSSAASLSGAPAHAA